jgi:hypothetical protein
MTQSEKRESRHITKQEDIDYLINITEEEIGMSFMMDTFGEFNGKSRFHPYDTFYVPEGAYGIDKKKNKKPCLTTVGIWIFNKYFIEKDLLNYLGYINYELNKGKYKNIVSKITDGVMEDDLDLSVLDSFLQKTQKLMPMCTVLTPNHTQKFLTCTKEINKRKKELAKKYAKELEAGDPVTAEKMEKELLAFAKEYLKDDPSMDLYTSGARSSFENHFKNMYVMKGAIRNPDPNAEKKYNIVLSNYSDGISKEDYPIIANSLAAGPYARAKKTEIGGYWEKLLVSAYQHLTLDPAGSDCGTNDTIEVELTERNYRDWMYCYIREKSGTLTMLTSKNCEKYIGKTVNFRYSSLCESKTGLCNKCMGDLFYKLNMNNIGVAMAKIPSTLKNISMKSFHDSNVKTTEIDVDKVFGLK